MAEKAYGGRLPDPPMEKACETRNRGDMPKTFVKSARRPLNIKLDSRTSFCTSLAMLSTVPGLDRPRAALRSENELYASLRAMAAEFSTRKEGRAKKSAIVVVCAEVNWREKRISNDEVDRHAGLRDVFPSRYR